MRPAWIKSVRGSIKKMVSELYGLLLVLPGDIFIRAVQRLAGSNYEGLFSSVASEMTLGMVETQHTVPIKILKWK